MSEGMPGAKILEFEVRCVVDFIASDSECSLSSPVLGMVEVHEQEVR